MSRWSVVVFLAAAAGTVPDDPAALAARAEAQLLRSTAAEPAEGDRPLVVLRFDLDAPDRPAALAAARTRLAAAAGATSVGWAAWLPAFSVTRYPDRQEPAA